MMEAVGRGERPTAVREHVEGELLSSEEAEQIVRIGLEHLGRRGVLLRDEGRIRLGSHARAGELLDDYARSLAALDSPAARQLAGRQAAR